MISANALTKRYGSTLAVDNLSFEVRPGVVTGFLGPNGAGKTTTMRMILGLDRPTSGSVTINGKRFDQLTSPMREVGALIDAHAVHGGRTAYDHLLCLAQSNAIPRRRVDEVLGIVGLESVAKKRCGGFSLGMGQRLGIAGALLGDPGVLMFDEPVNGLDPEGIVWVRRLMRSLAAEGRTILVSSHLMSEMALTADHLIVIGKGKLISDTGVSDFVDVNSEASVIVASEDSARLSTLLIDSGAVVEDRGDDHLEVKGVDTRRVGRIAADNAICLYELTTRRASLEDAFMQLTQDQIEYAASGNTTRSGTASGNTTPSGTPAEVTR